MKHLPTNFYRRGKISLASLHLMWHARYAERARRYLDDRNLQGARWAAEDAREEWQKFQAMCADGHAQVVPTAS